MNSDQNSPAETIRQISVHLASLLAYTDRVTLYRWIQKYSVEGDVGLERKEGSGRRRKLEELDEDALRGLILNGALHFGYETDLWTVGRLRRVITEEFSIVLSKNTVSSQFCPSFEFRW